MHHVLSVADIEGLLGLTSDRILASCAMENKLLLLIATVDTPPQAYYEVRSRGKVIMKTTIFHEAATSYSECS